MTEDELRAKCVTLADVGDALATAVLELFKAKANAVAAHRQCNETIKVFTDRAGEYMRQRDELRESRDGLLRQTAAMQRQLNLLTEDRNREVAANTELRRKIAPVAAFVRMLQYPGPNRIGPIADHCAISVAYGAGHGTLSVGDLRRLVEPNTPKPQEVQDWIKAELTAGKPQGFTDIAEDLQNKVALAGLVEQKHHEERLALQERVNGRIRYSAEGPLPEGALDDGPDLATVARRDEPQVSHMTEIVPMTPEEVDAQYAEAKRRAEVAATPPEGDRVAAHGVSKTSGV